MSESSIVFIAGSRDISLKRIHQLFCRYKKKGEIIWGVYKEPTISGFVGQAQFATLAKSKLKKYFDFYSRDISIRIIEYKQEEEESVIESLGPQKVIFIYGSWKLSFYKRHIYQFLKDKNIKFSLKSAFMDENEAMNYATKMMEIIDKDINYEISQKYNTTYNKDDNYFLEIADIVAKKSFDYTWQTGAVLVRDGEILVTGYNKILPFDSYTMHYGSLKERGLGKFSSGHINDMNVNDTLHAEMDILSQVLNKQMDISGSTLYVSLMPCPNCARMLAMTRIKKIVCKGKHFGGLAEKILSHSGIEIIVK